MVLELAGAIVVPLEIMNEFLGGCPQCVERFQ